MSPQEQAREIEAVARQLGGWRDDFFWNVAPESCRMFWRDLAVERIEKARAGSAPKATPTGRSNED